MTVPLAVIVYGFAVHGFAAQVAVSAVQSALPAHRQYDDQHGYKLVPLLTEVLRFPTVAGNDKARRDQQAWLVKTGVALGLTVREAGLVTEIELPGPEGAPVLGLLVHGDVQPVEADKWTIPPFEGSVRDGVVLGRGSADDKGPLVQALLAMIALRDSGLQRTHTVRLLVGSDEESSNKDIAEYLRNNVPPPYSLVLDSAFPVVVGEKAWNALHVSAPIGGRSGGPAFPYEVAALEAGLSPSIVPDQAQITLSWRGGETAQGSAGGEEEEATSETTIEPDWRPLIGKLQARKLPSGVRLEIDVQGDRLIATTRGKSAHGGVNLEGGRNALVGLAQVMEGALPRGGAQDLLAVARLAGRDLYGTGLGLTRKDLLWGRYAVNVATLKPAEGGAHQLVINLRRTPPLTGPQLKSKLDAWVAAFNKRTGATLVPAGFYDDEPLVFDPRARIVRRLMAAYTRATGLPATPAISGGGTYAKRMPNSIAFGMWFPGKPYPGHDVDEQVPVADLHRGSHVLIEALVDLACGAPIAEPFRPISESEKGREKGR